MPVLNDEFAKWLDEPQTVSTRRERLEWLLKTFVGEDHASAMFQDWIKSAFVAGTIYGERGMSGAAGEAAKDCRKAGFNDAYELIIRKTIPNTIATEKANAAKYLSEQ